jgi:small-conductance mechanosensitive channel
MQNKLYHWFFFVCFLFLPICSDAKIDSKNTTPLANPIFANEQRHFPTANPLDRFRMPKKLRNFLEKQASIKKNDTYTEGGNKKTNDKRKALWQRIFTVLLLVAAGVLLVYWLQGTIGLALAGLGIASYWRNKDRIIDWERRRQERVYAYEKAPSKYKDYKGKSTDSLSHPANNWTRRALTRFLFGIGLTFLSIVFLVLSILSSGDAIIALTAIMLIIGFVLVFTSLVNAIKAISIKEPQSAWAWIVVILGLPFILSLLLSLALGF